MQTEITQIIIQKVPMLSEEQQRKLLSITESFLNETATQTGWSALKKAIADNQINSGVGDLAKQHDHYIYGTEKK
jgi:hypothetical protein